MTYRTLDPAARESAALRALGKRRTRLRGRVTAAALLVGIALGIAGDLLVDQLQFAALGRAYLLLSTLFGFVPPVVASGALGLRFARLLVRRRTEAWLTELAAEHRVRREALAEEVKLLHRVEAEAELGATDG